jgi:hypothetical protein
MSAFVYLLYEVPLAGDSSGPWTKIGHSKNDPHWRLEANLTRGNPRDLRLAVYYRYSSPTAARAAERSAHAAFERRRHQKEWFRIHWTRVAAWFARRGARPIHPPENASPASRRRLTKR